jgi:hypothetical protein
LFSGLLKSNDTNIYKALLVGVLRVAKSGFLSDLNNLRVYPMFESRYADKFGFVEDEVKIVLSYHEIRTSVMDIANWYDSYTAGKDVKLYNPWSIISICDLKELKSYWVATGSTSSIKELLWRADIDFQKQVDLLLQRQSIDVDIQYELLQADPENSLWSLLYYAGYLTGTIHGSTFRVNIPNHEVLLEWKGWFSKVLKSSSHSTASLLQFLLTGNGEQFSIAFPSALESCLTYFNVGGEQSGKKAESFYHAVCIGLFMHARDHHCEVKSEGTAGKGRFF